MALENKYFQTEIITKGNISWANLTEKAHIIGRADTYMKECFFKASEKEKENLLYKRKCSFKEDFSDKRLMDSAK